MKTTILFILSLIWNWNITFCQQVENGSFESEYNGADVQAYPWSKCSMTNQNTPDLYPGVYPNVTQSPSHGSSYLNMVVRENGTKETVFGKIVPPMLPNECYRISFDAMVSEQMVLESWGEVRDYTNPAGLAIDFGNTQCQPLVTAIYVEDLLPGTEWENYSFIHQPTFDTYGIRLRNYFIGPDYYYGHIFVDNLHIQKSGDTTYLPTMFVETTEDVVLSMPIEEGFSYVWESNEVTCLDCPSTIANPNETTRIIGTKIDSTGCFIEYFSFQLIMPPSVPNVFTPNNDLINDIFFIKNLPQVSSLTVTNRWGQQVYFSKNYDNNWDGTIDGHMLPDGVYFYSLDYEENRLSGFFHLVK